MHMYRIKQYISQWSGCLPKYEIVQWMNLWLVSNIAIIKGISLVFSVTYIIDEANMDHIGVC